MSYYLAFAVGFSILLIELCFPAMIEPFFGRNNSTWAITLSVIMLGFFCGYCFGGRYCDRYQGKSWLSAICMMSGAWLLGVAVLIKPFSTLLLNFVGSDFLDVQFLFLVATLLTSFLFVWVPVTLLASLEPYLIKQSTRFKSEIGEQSGFIFFSTSMGSFVALFLCMYIFIPTIGSKLTVALLGTVLLCYGCWVGMYRSYLVIAASWAIVLCVICFNMGIHGDVNVHHLMKQKKGNLTWQEKVIFEKESIYQYVQISDKPYATLLKTNAARFYAQSAQFKDGFGSDYTHVYTDVLALSQMKRLLVLGLGYGSMVQHCLQANPDLHIDVVELDPVIIQRAQEDVLHYPEKVTIHNLDARQFLLLDQDKYDAIFIDLYMGPENPWTLNTKEFWQLVKERCHDDTFIAFNKAKRSDSINQYILATIQHVFPYLYVSGKGGDYPQKFNLISMKPRRFEAMPKISNFLRSLLPYESDFKEIITDNRSVIDFISFKNRLLRQD
eukprot:COSAG01_NODE_3_length_63519_cov_1591.007663_32_plen_497_part_00